MKTNVALFVFGLYVGVLGAWAIKNANTQTDRSPASARTKIQMSTADYMRPGPKFAD